MDNPYSQASSQLALYAAKIDEQRMIRETHSSHVDDEYNEGWRAGMRFAAKIIREAS